jgi:hypothetical protein
MNIALATCSGDDKEFVFRVTEEACAHTSKKHSVRGTPTNSVGACINYSTRPPTALSSSMVCGQESWRSKINSSGRQAE